ncbi:SpoIIE family protein phosphatase, partial [Candidatus Dependentiae bacterium]|nr:SpoIIE family protein phosphatase [Candidatus Dependentiae bacterium]
IKEAKNKNMSYRVLNNTFISDEFDDFTEQFNSMMEHIENEKITELISVIKKLMPEEKIESSGFNFVSYYKPSKEIGGDFIDVFDINENKKAIVIADVVGKSFPAAFLMVLGMTSIKLLSKKFSYPPEFIFELNRFLRVNTPPGKWITMIYSILDTKTGEIEILNCGHPEAFIFSQNKITEFSSTFPMIGELSDEKFKKYIDDYKSSHTTKFKLAAGDLFFLYTDGLSDSVNNEKNYFNIKSSVDQSFKSDYSAEKLKNKIIEQLTEFSVKDDLTFLLITKQN